MQFYLKHQISTKYLKNTLPKYEYILKGEM